MTLGRKARKCCARGLLAGTMVAMGLTARAQDKPAAEAAKPAATEVKKAAETTATGPSFMDVVFRGGIVNTVIWLMIFGTSAATAAFIIDALLSIKRSKLLPDDLIEGVRQSLDQGDLDAAIETCEANPGALSNLLLGGFGNITEGDEVVQE